MAIDQARRQEQSRAIDHNRLPAWLSDRASDVRDRDDAAIVNSHESVTHWTDSLGRHDRHVLDLKVCRRRGTRQGNCEHKPA
jgi:hypothetical protein